MQPFDFSKLSMKASIHIKAQEGMTKAEEDTFNYWLSKLP
jgi:hypothetical protein